MVRKITGWHVFGCFALAFSVIITVNLTLAINAVRTFPGLEVSNSYVASQSFDADRDAQEALNWDVSADLVGHNILRLVIEHDGVAQMPSIEQATFGRATSVARDQELDLVFDGSAFTAPVTAGTGNWNLRLKARAADGTLFQQRIIVRAAR
jgi:nitrogen fixation protein FixH